MKTVSNAAVGVVLPLVLVLGLASAGCTRSDGMHVVPADRVARPQAPIDVAPSLYPPIQSDAAEGNVHEYY
jgi:hypothetical protein